MSMSMMRNMNRRHLTLPLGLALLGGCGTTGPAKSHEAPEAIEPASGSASTARLK